MYVQALYPIRGLFSTLSASYVFNPDKIIAICSYFVKYCIHVVRYSWLDNSFYDIWTRSVCGGNMASNRFVSSQHDDFSFPPVQRVRLCPGCLRWDFLPEGAEQPPVFIECPACHG